jgi:hypothetical protein
MNLQDLIQQWKQMYEAVYSITILNQDFIFRVIGREEYKAILEQDLSIGQFQEEICRVAVLYPQDFDYREGLAGIAETLSNAILEMSGLHQGQAKALLDQYRDEMMIFDYQVDCIIHEAFPQYSIEEIQNWSVKKMMYYLSRAEWILKNLRGVPLLSMEDILQQQETENPVQPQPPSVEQKQNGSLSKEEVEALLSQKEGRPISLDNESKLGQDLFPELSWFKAEEELKGEYD